MPKPITNEVLAEKIDNLAETVGKINDTINGNGRPGLKSDVRILMDDRANRQKYVWVIRTAFVTTVLGSIAAVIKSFFLNG